MLEEQTLNVTATVTNTGKTTATQTITLATNATQRDSTSVTLASGESKSVTLSWLTDRWDAGNYTATVSSANNSTTVPVIVKSAYETQYGINSTYMLDGGDRFHDLAATNDDGYVAVGTARNASDYADTGTWIIKIDANGTEEWNRTITTENREKFKGVVQTSDGGYLAVGVTDIYSNEKAWAVRYDATGAMLWEQTYATAETHSTFEDIVKTSDGFAVAGKRSINNGSADGWVIELDTSGAKQWAWTGGGPHHDQFVALQQTTDGGYVAVGEDQWDTNDSNVGLSRNAWMVKLSSDGASEWNRTYGDWAVVEDFQSVRQTADGGYVAAGSTTNTPDIGESAWLLRTDAAGVEEWNRTYSPEGGSYEWWNDVRQLSNGDFFLAGSTDGFNNGDRDAWLMRVDGTGYERTSWLVNGLGDEDFTSVVATGSEQFAVAGFSESWNPDYAGWLLEADIGVPVNTPPTADIIAPSTATVGATYTLDGTGSSDSDGTIDSYVWAINGSQIGTGSTLTHTFGSTGTKTLTLTVTDDDGNTDTTTTTVTVTNTNSPPTADIIAPSTATVGTTYTFDGTGSSDADGSISSYVWAINGSQIGTGSTTAYTFTSEGTKTLTLTVTDDDGNTDVRNQTVTVKSKGPTANFTYSGPPNYVGEPIVFNASSTTDPTDDIVSYEWDMEADGTYEINYTDPTNVLTYVNAGTKTVRLRVTDDDGNTDVINRTVTIQTGEPTANFTVSKSRAKTGEPIVFNASSTTDPTDDVVSYEWDMEADGTYEISSSNPTQVLTYVNAGTKTIRLRVTDDDGNTDVASRTVAIVDRTPPTVDLSAIDANASAKTPPTGQTVYTNGTLSVAATADDVSGSVSSVLVALRSDRSNFRAVFGATQASETNWTKAIDLSNTSAVPDDGNYSLTLTAVDTAGNVNVTTTNETVVLDREEPELAATISQVNDSTGQVNVTATEQLSGVPTVSVELPNGTTEIPSVTSKGPTRWNGTFNLTGTSSGQYNVTVTGTDLAGNVGTDAATSKIGTVSTQQNETAMVVLEPSGMFVDFTTANATNDTVVLTRSDSALAPLNPSQTGVAFLDARLGDALDANLSHAVIGMPVPAQLPGDVDPSTVSVAYYNESNLGSDKWEAVNTTVEQRTINGTTRQYWIATVTHFSTYGAVASDDTAPTLDTATPTGDLSVRIENQTVRFEYSDDLSGVNASNVTLAFDGSDVTANTSAAITSQYASFDATGLSTGTHTATVTVADAAGNADTFTLSFSIPKASNGGGGIVPPPTQTKAVQSLADGGADVTIQNGVAGQTAEVNLDGIEAGSATFDRLQVSYAYDLQELAFQVHPSADLADGTPDLESGTSLGFLTVEKSVQNDYFESVEFRFALPRSALPEEASRDDVALYRYDGSSWSKLETSRREDTYTATAPGFSVFAVGVDATDEKTPQQTPDTNPSPTSEEQMDSTTPSDGTLGSRIDTRLIALLGIATGLIASLGIGLARRRRR
ncbi:PKD domain-containing protein [Halovivax cerinus]|uniref:PKD domain-containing protein n=1 Tax=Halovivax cerinus TaxID=1487865 RepID=A0ABD5NTC1_9EURY|nr:PKD domain-containing protein [Halovivax cerinus]